MICAPETSHAIAGVIDEANKCRESGKEKVIIFTYSGHGLMDLAGYDAFMSGKLTEYSMPQEDIEKFTAVLKDLPKAPGNEKPASGKIFSYYLFEKLTTPDELTSIRSFFYYPFSNNTTTITIC